MRWLGGVLALAGIVLLASMVWPGASRWEVATEPLPLPEDFAGHYPLASLTRWRVHDPGSDRRLTLHIARYHHGDGQSHQAILPTPGSPAWQQWQELGKTLQTLEPDAMILAWWDDGQRIDLLSGRECWVLQPPAQAFPPKARDVWRLLSGGFGDRKGKLVRLSKWLTGSPDTSLKAITQAIPDRHLYLLVNSASLSRVDEIERLSGHPLPLELRIFPPTDDFHTQITAVRRWAQETGLGYLPRKVPAGISAWRLTTSDEPLLLRLLPFTSHPPGPLPGLSQVFQSQDRQLQLFRLPSQNLD